MRRAVVWTRLFLTHLAWVELCVLGALGSAGKENPLGSPDWHFAVDAETPLVPVSIARVQVRVGEPPGLLPVRLPGIPLPLAALSGRGRAMLSP